MALMGMETPQLVIADVGTGTGAIAINLALHLPAARIYAVDNSDAVLDVAAYNVRIHNVADRVTLGKGDLLEPVPEPVDLILANLPYLPTDRIPNLQPEIRWEPRQALDGGPDGLDLIRRLLHQAPAKLKEHGIILLGTGPGTSPRRRRHRQRPLPRRRVVSRKRPGPARPHLRHQPGPGRILGPNPEE